MHCIKYLHWPVFSRTLAYLMQPCLQKVLNPSHLFLSIPPSSSRKLDKFTIKKSTTIEEKPIDMCSSWINVILRMLANLSPYIALGTQRKWEQDNNTLIKILYYKWRVHFASLIIFVILQQVLDFLCSLYTEVGQQNWLHVLVCPIDSVSSGKRLLHMFEGA